MDDLIQLVTESIARHGIECPTVDSQTVEPVSPAEAPIPAKLAEHNYRKTEAIRAP
jgi:hypothetical protein